MKACLPYLPDLHTPPRIAHSSATGCSRAARSGSPPNGAHRGRPGSAPPDSVLREDWVDQLYVDPRCTAAAWARSCSRRRSAHPRTAALGLPRNLPALAFSRRKASTGAPTDGHETKNASPTRSTPGSGSGASGRARHRQREPGRTGAAPAENGSSRPPTPAEQDRSSASAIRSAAALPLASAAAAASTSRPGCRYEPAATSARRRRARPAQRRIHIEPTIQADSATQRG